MDERFPDEFVTWHHNTPVGVKVDEVFGMDSKSGNVWIALAKQIFCEQGIPNYRVIDHFESGIPYLEEYQGRISITHTSHFFAVAFLPKTSDIPLDSFNPRTAMGIDAEPLDRSQVFKIREKFLSDKELENIPKDDLKANIIAWTAKEALYKAALTPGIDFKNNIQIIKLPELSYNPPKFNQYNLGEALIIFDEELKRQNQQMKLYSYESYGCCVTIALSHKCATFGKH